MSGSTDGRATFAELNTNFTERIFQKTASELKESSWRILSYKKNYWDWIPKVIDVFVAISSRNIFLIFDILDVRFYIVVRRDSRLLGEDWKLALAELFVFALVGPTAPSVVEQRTDGSSQSHQGIGSAIEIGFWLGLGLRIGIRIVGGLIAEFSTDLFLIGVVPTEEKSKWRNPSKSFWCWRTIICIVLRSSCDGGTVEWSCELPVGVALDVGEMRAKDLKTQEGVEQFLQTA